MPVPRAPLTPIAPRSMSPAHGARTYRSAGTAGPRPLRPPRPLRALPRLSPIQTKQIGFPGPSLPGLGPSAVGAGSDVVQGIGAMLGGVAGTLGGGDGGESLGTFQSTAYGPPWDSMNGTGVTAGGTDLRPAKKAYIVAVDPEEISLGTKLTIEPNPFGYKGTFLADDTGGAIQGKRIDFYDWRGRSSQLAWGTRPVKVTKGAAASASGFGLPNPLAGIDAVAQAIAAAAGALNDIAAFFTRWIELFFTPTGWARLAKISFGAVCILWGMNVIIREISGKDVVKAAGGAAKTGATVAGGAAAAKVI